MVDRSYTSEELALIIRRAAQVHAMEPDVCYSLTDVQQIAAQVGLPPDLVAAVAEDVDKTGARSGSLRLLLGPPARFISTATVERHVTSEDYPRLLDLIRSQLKVIGEVTQVGPAFEWRIGGSTAERVGSTIVTITPNCAGTKVRVESNITPLQWTLYATAVFAGAVCGLIGSIEAGASPLVTAAATVGGPIIAWAITRKLWSRVAREVEVRADRLRQLIAAQLAVSDLGTEVRGS